MSIEPKCDYCDAVTKFRCNDDNEMLNCTTWKAQQKIKDSVKGTMKKMKKENKVSESVKEMAELANRSCRSTVAVIDALSQRGAFKGEELMAIGQLRDQSTQLIQLAETVQSEIAEQEKTS